MKRRILTILSALSLLLCAGTACMWGYVKSSAAWVHIGPEERGDSINFGPSVIIIKHVLQLDNVHVPADTSLKRMERRWGSFGLLIAHDAEHYRRLDGSAEVNPNGSFAPQRVMPTLPGDLVRTRLLPALEPSERPAPRYVEDVVLTHRNYLVRVPYWAVLLATLVLPAFWFRLWRHARLRRWRIAHGRCTACGYDLRASKDRCPECGAPVPS